MALAVPSVHASPLLRCLHPRLENFCCTCCGRASTCRGSSPNLETLASDRHCRTPPSWRSDGRQCRRLLLLQPQTCGGGGDQRQRRSQQRKRRRRHWRSQRRRRRQRQTRRRPLRTAQLQMKKEQAAAAKAADKARQQLSHPQRSLSRRCPRQLQQAPRAPTAGRPAAQNAPLARTAALQHRPAAETAPHRPPLKLSV